MCHNNKNEILDYYYNLDEPKNRAKVKKHIETCSECKEYLNDLIETGKTLDMIKPEKPLPDTFETILSSINEVPQIAKPAARTMDSVPILKIAITILFVLLGLYFLQSKMEFLDIWNSIEKSWLVKTFGKYSFIIVAFFSMGSLVTLALAPILFMQSNKGKRIIIK
ncbi:MAG: hypothetical protein ACEPO8_08425 [Rhodothermaceae bacterium]